MVPGEDAAVPAVHDASRCTLPGVQREACTVDDGGELWGLRQHRHEAGTRRPQPGVDVEAEQARRVQLAETAKKGWLRYVPQPALADEGSLDKGGREAGTEEDLNEEVVVIEHLRYGVRRHRRQLPLAFHIALVSVCSGDSVEKRIRALD